MLPVYFAQEAAAKGLPLGLSLSAFLVQLITFIFVFFVLKRFAFKPIIKMLEKRRQTIEDGLLLGEEMQAEKAKLEETTSGVVRDARIEADGIIADGQKEAREIIRGAETTGQRRNKQMLDEANAQIAEESERSKRKLEKDVVTLVGEATEAVVGQKMDSKIDKQIIEKVVKDKIGQP